MHSPVFALRHAQVIRRVFCLALLALFAVTAMASTVDEELKLLIPRLSSADAVERAKAAEALGVIGDPRALDSLLAMQKDASPEVRKQLVNALANFKDPRVLDAIIAALNDPSTEVAGSAAFVARRFQEQRVVTALLDALAKRKDAELRQSIIWSLAGCDDKRVVPALSPLLKDEDLVMPVVHALCEISDPAVIEPLTAQLHDKTLDKYQKGRIIEALGNTGDPRVITTLVEMLQEKDYSITSNAEDGLRAFGEKALPQLEAAVKSTHTMQAVRALHLVCEFSGPRTTEILKAAFNDPRAELREAAIVPLATAGDAKAFALLLERVETSDPREGWEAMSALLRTGDAGRNALLAMLKDPTPATRLQAATILARVEDPQVIPSLIDALRDADAGVRGAVAQALSQRNDTRLPDLFFSLAKDPVAGVRAAAISFLAQTKDPRATDLLLAAVADGSPEVRVAALAGLAQLNDARVFDLFETAMKGVPASSRALVYQGLLQMKDPRVLPLLAPALKERDPYQGMLGMMVISAAIKNQSAETVQLLCMALQHDSEEVRQQAGMALMKMRDPAVVPALIEQLKSDDPDTRLQVSMILGWTKDPRAQEPLAALLKDEDPLVREMAAEALAVGYHDPRAAATLVEGIPAEGIDGDQAAEALVMLGSAAVEPLLSLLKHRDPTYRAFAANILSEVPDPRAEKALTPLLKDKDEEVRGAAADALAAIKVARIVGMASDPATTDRLVAIARDAKESPDARMAALESLEKQGYAHLADLTVSLLKNRKTDPGAVKLAPAAELVYDSRLPALLREILAEVRQKKPSEDGYYQHQNEVERVSLALRAFDDLTATEAMVNERIAASRENDNEIYDEEPQPSPVISPEMFAKLASNLSSGPWQGRVSSAKQLGKSADPRAGAPLVSALQDAYPPVRKEAADALMRLAEGLNTPEDRAKLTNMLTPLLDSTGDTREYAVNVLGKLGDSRVAPMLLERVRQPRERPDFTAITLLGETGNDQDGKITEVLLPLLDHTESSIRYAAVIALTRLRNPRAGDAIFAASKLEEGRKPVKRYEQKTEIPFGLALLSLDDQRGFDLTLRELRHRGDLENLLSDYSRHANALDMPHVQPGPRVMASLHDLLRDPAHDDHWGAIVLATLFNDPAALDPALALLRESPEMPMFMMDPRGAALRMLSRFKGPRIVEPIITLLQDPELAGQAAKLLGEIGDSRAVEPLIAAIQSPQRLSNGREIIETLVKFNDPRSKEALLQFLMSNPDRYSDGDDLRARLVAIQGLAALKEPRAVEAIISFLRYETYDETSALKARMIAAKALNAITGQTLGLHYGRWRAWQRAQAGKGG